MNIYEWEESLNDIISRKISKSNQNFIILDKEWIEKWKKIIGYETIKEKCKLYNKKNNESIKKEISDFF